MNVASLTNESLIIYICIEKWVEQAAKQDSLRLPRINYKTRITENLA